MIIWCVFAQTTPESRRDQQTHNPPAASPWAA